MEIFKVMRLIIQREYLLNFRNGSDCLRPLMFFVVVVSIFPLATTSDPNILRIVGPAVIWVSVLLAVLLSLNKLFQEDHLDGSLEQWVITPLSLPVLVFVKVMTYWFMMCVPIIIIAPLSALMFHLSMSAIVTLVFSLLLGTPVLYLMGAIVSAVTVGLRNSGLLLTLLLLPLYIPTLIFGSSAVSAVNLHHSADAQLAFLGAILSLTVTFAPLATAFSLRMGVEYDK